MEMRDGARASGRDLPELVGYLGVGVHNDTGFGVETGAVGFRMERAMAAGRVKRNRAAPFEVALRTEVALKAVHFFNPMNYVEVCEKMGWEQGKLIPALSGDDFLGYLKKVGVLSQPMDYVYRIRDILVSLEANGILIDQGRDRRSPLFYTYFFLGDYSPLRAQGVLWLAKSLGADFVLEQVKETVIHVTGRSKKNGSSVGGSGIVFDKNHILTCRHVVEDMELDRQQVFQGKQCAIDGSAVHVSHQTDVAVIRVEEDLTTVPGLVFCEPSIAKTVFTLGYPRIPFVREACLVMQRGEVTRELVTSLRGESLFLYSAISRPGNSGGPIISDDGYIVGISSESIEGKYEAGEPLSPHYAGVPAQVVAQSVIEFQLGVEIPFEAYE